ncbi:hypothetical protein [Commensalibacter oyaizuii]|uniref:Uncharacterized protein n=1 Tax=Commensalibacter oyaizuii TaxID=3043873 RepID=A0ABT6Q337_9PROT|nr:hypothetical protein [Commensalibacter sp. TBRC 16381]MDI2091435.1 hypothetical protein [Commensalibacter sp. TBRC 16381]
MPRPDHSFCIENGMAGGTEPNAQIKQTWQIIHSQTPKKIITFGGDCLISLAHFA